MSATRREAARFPTTRWSLVDVIRRGDARATREALEELLGRYLPALRAHVVYRRRISRDEADDLVQEFIASRILEKDLIARADRNRGRFRSYLLKSLDRFLIDWVRHARAKRRSPGDGAIVPLDDQDQSLEWQETPSGVFHATWARGVVAEALRRVRSQCESSSRMDLWGILECRLLDPILKGTEPADYGQLVKRFELKSPAQASNLLITARRMCARALRAVVAEYAQDDQEIESEIAELKEILAQSGGG